MARRWRYCRNCKHTQSGGNGGRDKGIIRHRASPVRIMRLYPDLTAGQRKLIEDAGFGGLLRIRCPAVPARLCTWLLRRFDGGSCELVISGRGRIPVTADSVHRVLGIPNSGRDVEYKLDEASSSFVLDRYGGAAAPSVVSLERSIKTMKSPDEHFLRTFMMIVISTFLCPNTGLKVSPRCFPPLVDIGSIGELNWCKFVVEQLRTCISSFGKKNSVGGCLFYLVILYLDSIDAHNIEIPDGTPRISVWNKKLIDKVIYMDTKSSGSSGKCSLKKVAAGDVSSSRAGAASSASVLFGDVSAIANFVSSNVLPGCSPQNKEVLGKATSNFCSSITDALSKFMHEVSGLEGGGGSRGETSKGTAAGAAPAVEDTDVENSGECRGEAGKDISGVALVEDNSDGDQMDVDTLQEDMEDTSDEDWEESDLISVDSEDGSSRVDSEDDPDWEEDDSNRVTRTSRSCDSEVPGDGTAKSGEGTSKGSGHDSDVLVKETGEHVNVAEVVTPTHVHEEMAAPTPPLSRAKHKQQENSQKRFEIEDKTVLKRLLHPIMTPPGFEPLSAACALHAVATRSRCGSLTEDKMAIQTAGTPRGGPSSLKLYDEESLSKGDMDMDRTPIVDLSSPTSSDSECTVIRTVSNPPPVNGPVKLKCHEQR